MNIGEFAEQSQLSAKDLRLYDELGVRITHRVPEAPNDPAEPDWEFALALDEDPVLVNSH